MNRIAAALLTSLMTLSLAAAGVAQVNRDRPSRRDAQFLREAAQGGVAEVRMGRLAMRMGRNNSVRQFGRRMVEDHSAANQELIDIATTEGVRVPRTPGPQHMAMMSRLQRLSGPAFDRAYMAEMVRDHRKDVAAFANEARNGSGRDVREFARRTLPTLREHLRMAVEIARSVGAPTRGM